MKGKKDSWKLWIDTGGTFTDAIAISPEGDSRRLKVLSTGCLRAQLEAEEGDCCYRLTARWPVERDIFGGYAIRLLSSAALLGEVASIDLAAGLLYSRQPLALSLPAFIELTAGEEAPVLAARLATGTPLSAPLPHIQLRLGSTKGTNALLERKGSPVLLYITEGFEDLPYIGNQQRPDLFQLDIPSPAFVPTRIVGVRERMASDGQPLLPLSSEEIDRCVAACDQPAVAIAFLNAYRNPAHEQQLGAALRAAGQPYLSLSSSLTPTVKLLNRMQTALVNAYLAPIIHPYLDRIARHLSAFAEADFLVMSSGGSLSPYRSFQPRDSLLSGPAGGAAGAARVAAICGLQAVITLDMGGTSTDTTRFDQDFDYRFQTEIDGIQLQAPALDIETVAAGGGSVCAVNNGQLTVGPESAGAQPGPACYGAGGPLTLTDINLLLGKLDPRLMGIPVSYEAATQALRRLQEQLLQETGQWPAELALLKGFEQIANEKMAEAIRRISIARGYQPAGYTLLAFGGAGGLHACDIASMLGMERVLIPADAGLLSAYGIGHAAVERMAERQLLSLLSDCQEQLPIVFQQLCQEASDLLLAEGFSPENLRTARALIFVRFRGQETTLELAFSPTDYHRLHHDFQEKYQEQYGYFPQDHPMEAESMRVWVCLAPPPVGPPAAPATPFTAAAAGATAGFEKASLYLWPELAPGARCAGPAVLAGHHSTAYLPAGWQLDMLAGGHALLSKQQAEAEARQQQAEAAALTLFTQRFKAIADAMGAQLQRTAFSVNIKERLDFSCALLDQHGQLLVNAPHIPVHLGSLGICARLSLQRQPLQPGDILIVNHPMFGGSHLPDVTLLKGVFTDEGQLIGYVINRAHHAEIGGSRPGSMPPDASCLAEEGVVFAPWLLFEKGIARWEVLRERLLAGPWPSRMPDDNVADLHAAVSALQTGEQALRKLAQQHGLDCLHYYMEALQAKANERLWQSLRPWYHQCLQAEEYMDDYRKIKLQVQLSDQQMTIDLRGSSDRHPGNLNANVSIVYSAIVYVLRLLCGGDSPLNEGLLRQVEIILPPDSFLHPRFEEAAERCPAVVGGNTEVSQRLTDTLLKAFGLAAASQGTMNNFLLGNAHFGYYETLGGGSGAGPGFHGRSGVHQHMTNTRITDPEELERRYPVRLRRFSLRKDSGGQGQYRGGDGLIREVEALQPLEVTLLTQRRREGPYGWAGGEAGRPGRQYILRTNGANEELPGIAAASLQPGDSIVIETPGGGGWGA